MQDIPQTSVTPFQRGLKILKEFTGFKNKLNDESGQITLDFIFAVGIAFGFSVLFFAMSYSLSMIEVCQYVTYSATRTYYAANTTLQAQTALGEQKFKELKSKGVLKTIFTNGWVTLSDIKFDNFSAEYGDADAGADAAFIGGRAKFKASVLNLHLPFVGNSINNTGGGTGSATINAYLLREVSTDECVQGFASQRFQQMNNVGDGRYGAYLKGGFVIRDNGC